MRIGVVGAGAIGGTIAALLDRAGHEVAVTARGAHLAAIREHGLRLEGGWGEHTAAVPAAEVLPEPPELALLTVKAQDAAAAAAAHREVLDGVPVVVVQNGLGGPRALHQQLPRSPLVGGLSLVAAAHLEPGVVTVTGPNTTVLAPDTATPQQLREVAAVLRQAVPIDVTDDLLAAQWLKLVVNQLNAAPAVTGVSAQESLASPTLRTAVTAAMRETVRVSRAAGVRLHGLPGLTPRVAAILLRLPPSVSGRLVAARLVAGMGGVPNLGSTLQSIRRGVPSEIDHLSGAVVAEGARLGVPTPVNGRVVELVHEVETSGRFLPPEDAARRLLG